MKKLLYFFAAVVILYCCNSCAPMYKGTISSVEKYHIITVDNNKFIVTDTPKVGKYVTISATGNRRKANAYAIGHHCEWILCPYKTITPDMYADSVKRYTEQFDTMPYWLDMMHLKYPRDSYEKLQSRALKIMADHRVRLASLLMEINYNI